MSAVMSQKFDLSQLLELLRFQFIRSLSMSSNHLSVPLDNKMDLNIKDVSNNSALSSLLVAISSFNAGMMSINGRTFCGYVITNIIENLQDGGRCDQNLLEVLRTGLTDISKKSEWNDFEELYNFCVEKKIIASSKIQDLPTSDDGSHKVAPILNGKAEFVCLKGNKWIPSRLHFANGVCSSDGDSRFQISAIILHNGAHFLVIVVRDGFWLIDGKEKRTGELTAGSTINRLTCVEAQKMCAEHDTFYFLEEVPIVYENVVLSGKKDLPPIKVIYREKFVFIHDDGKIIFQEPNKTGFLMNSFIGIDEFGKHIRVFPYLPPPPASPAPYAQVARALPPPQAACAQVSLVPEHKRSSITEYDIVVSAEKWICSIDPEYYGRVEKTPHPKYPITMMDVYFYQNVSHTTLDALVKFINFIKSIQ